MYALTIPYPLTLTIVIKPDFRIPLLCHAAVLLSFLLLFFTNRKQHKVCIYVLPFGGRCGCPAEYFAVSCLETFLMSKYHLTEKLTSLKSALTTSQPCSCCSTTPSVEDPHPGWRIRGRFREACPSPSPCPPPPPLDDLAAKRAVSSAYTSST